MVKTKTLIYVISVFLMLFLVEVLSAQYIPLSLDYKMENSPLIIEGKVTAQKCFVDDKDEIYTENVIEISKVHKGEFSEKYLSVITMGGKIGERTVFWTHLLDLSQSEYGVFFLTTSNRPKPEDSHYQVYEVFSGSQGFYHFQRKDNGVHRASATLDTYNSVSEFYQAIRAKNIDESPFISPFDLINEDDCLSFRIEPVSSTSLNSSASNSFTTNSQVWFNVMVKVNEGYYKLNKSELLLKYSTEWFYENMADEGYISFVQGEFDEAIYNFQFEDHESDIVKLKTEATTPNYNDLEAVEGQWKLLVSIGVTIKNISDEDPLQQLLDHSNIIENNYRTIQGYIEDFECVKLEYGANCGMEITSITPMAAAGVGLMSENGLTGVIEIQGNNFLDDEAILGSCIKPEDHHVKFRTIDDNWIAPFEGDYLEYTNTKIRVKVPSLGYRDNTDDIINDLNVQSACTGKVQVCRPHWFSGACGCSVISSDDLYIPFSAKNGSQINANGCRESVRVFLRDANEEGGYTIYFEDQFSNDLVAMDAFTNALNTWRCETGVNFDVNTTDAYSIGLGRCIVSFEDLGVGTETTTRAETHPIGPNCGLEPNNDFGAISFFRIEFNENINWDGSGISDLESTALHELGHAHLLLHTLNGEDKVMHPSKTVVVHDLSNDDLDGGNHIALLSSLTTDPDCPQPLFFEMNLVQPLDCIVSSSDMLKTNDLFLDFYPNPAQGQVKIHLDDNTTDNGYIVFVNMLGIQVTNEMLVSNTEIIDLSILPSGVYYVIYKSTLADKGEIIKKVIKQ